MAPKLNLIRQRKNNWREVVLVCRKCSKRAHGGFGPKGKTAFGKALRKFLGVKKGRHAEIGFIDADCFKLCPKKAVTVALGSDPGKLHVIPCGAVLADVAAALKLTTEPQASIEAEAIEIHAALDAAP